MMEFRAATITGTDVALDDSTVEEFGSSLHGTLLRVEDTDYNEARSLWNGMISKKPALIVRCANVDDVVKAVDFARENELLVAVRGGGHGVAGSAVCEGGLVVDLSSMKSIQVDPGRRTVRAEGGVTIGELDKETQTYGLATPMGVVSETGIAGLTLGGGIGWLRRKHGLSCDNLLSVELVTADGRLLKASESENPDLFWGIRGGVGGNFGVVTSFEYRLHPVGPEVMFCLVFHDGKRMEEALRFYREYAQAASEEISSFVICGTVPSEEPFPEEAHGDPYVLFGALYAGEVEEGERATRPLREFGDPLVDFSGPMPYVEVQSMLDADYPDGGRYYWKSLYLNSLDDEAIACIVEHTSRRPSEIATVDVWHMGGAISRVGTKESAFGGREAPFLLGVEANWEDPEHDEANISWARVCVEDMRSFSGGGEYLNFPGFLEGGEDTLKATFGQNYERLVALKNEYDPTNLFRLNQNIRPTALSSRPTVR